MLSDVDSDVLVWPHRLGFQSGPSCVQAIPRSLRLPDRICKIFGYHFTWSPLLRGGMPMSTATGHDSHSDREAARAFCPAYLLRSNSFDDIGAHLLQFIGNLMYSCWVSSKAYECHELAKNALSGYYLLLAAVYQAWQQRGKLWPLEFLPRTTVRNLASLSQIATTFYAL